MSDPLVFEKNERNNAMVNRINCRSKFMMGETSLTEFIAKRRKSFVEKWCRQL